MDSHNHSEPRFRFLIAEKKGIVIASFIGPLDRDAIPILKACEKELSEIVAAKWVILNFRDVPLNAEKIVLPTLAGLQKSVRQKPAVLRICALHPDLRKFLHEQGVVRPDEITNNLADTLMSLPAIGEQLQAA